MLGLSWPELMIISVVALIVIGPEDLPKMFRELGRFTAKLRQMSREFSRAMDQAAKETGVSDVARDLRNVTSPKALGIDAVKSAADKFEKWDPLKNAAKPSTPLASQTIKPPGGLTPPPMPDPVPMKPAAPEGEPDLISELLDGAGEEEDDILSAALDAAEAAASAPASAPVHGPATQALYDKAALKAQVLKEQTEKLKAIEAGTYQPEPVPEVATETPAPKKRAAKVKPEDGTAPAPAAKAKAPKAEGTAKPASKPRRKSTDGAETEAAGAKKSRSAGEETA